MITFIVTFLGRDKEGVIKNFQTVRMEREEILHVYEETNDMVFDFGDGLDYTAELVCDVNYLDMY